MSDLVVVSYSQTFEWLSVQVYGYLGFTPTLEDNTLPDFTTVNPNSNRGGKRDSFCFA
jgi:hypothetical protein